MKGDKEITPALLKPAMVFSAHLLAGLCLPPGEGEAGPPGPIGGQHEAAEDEEGEDLLEPGPPRPQHEADQRDKQRQAQEHVNIPDHGQPHMRHSDNCLLYLCSRRL